MRPPTPLLAALSMLMLAGIALAATLGGRDARAGTLPIEFAPYLRRADGRVADPINVIFVGERDATVVGVRVAAVMRWGPVAGDDMAFVERGVPRWAELQVGTPQTAGLRRHIRLAGAAGTMEKWGVHTLGAVHHDVTVPCGHLGAGFDDERDTLARAMERAGYRVSWLWLGNDAAVEHCDGSTTHGDGWVAVIDMRPGGEASPSPSPSASPSPAPSAEPSPSPSPIASATPSPTPTPTPSRAPSPSPSPTPEPPRERPSDLAAGR